MGAVLGMVAVLLGLLALLLVVPLDVAFRFERIEAFKGQIAIRWLFGLVRFCFRIPGATESPEPQAAPDAPKLRVKPEKRGRPANALAVFRQAAFRRRVYRLVKDLAGAARLHELRFRVRLGLGDPADTGRLWALLGPLSAAAMSLRNVQVKMEPEFMDPVFEFHADGRLLLIPARFLVLAIGFALSPVSIRAWRSL